VRPGGGPTFGGPGGPRGPGGPGGHGPGGGPSGPVDDGGPTGAIRLGPAGGPGGPPLSPDAQHVDQLRRTFQPRRFGSGYDRGEVDDLFDGIMSTMSGRGRPVAEADLDPRRFNLVPGGYYEDEVDNALREVRDMLRRH
jgi:hypothetical protein